MKLLAAVALMTLWPLLASAAASPPDLPSPPPFTQSQCAPAGVALHAMAVEFGEVPLVMLRDDDGDEIVITAKSDHSTWSELVFTEQDGARVACMIFAGHGGQE